MRTEQEMLDLIIGVAQADPRIKAVYMNGSRTNPNADRDMILYMQWRKQSPFRKMMSGSSNLGSRFICSFQKILLSSPVIDIIVTVG